jgi:tetratricopeptide (TPR) repeat protein
MRWLALLLGLTLASHALAANAKANQLAKDGDRLYKDGKYREAAETLKQAYELDKNPVLLFNIARAYDQAGDLQIALDTYRQYVALEDTDPQLVKRANLAMDRLRALVARTEADKQVQEAESRRLKEEADSAKRKAEAEADAARRQREEFEAKEAARTREANKGAGTRKIAGIAPGALAVAGLGCGIAFGALANGSKQAFNSALTVEDKVRTEGQTKTQALIADISFAAALALGITFAVVFPWGAVFGGDAQTSVHVALGPTGVALGGSF